MFPSQETNVAPGDVLGGKYRVLRQIGRGGMGVVVEAAHEAIGERVAIKVLHDRYRDNQEAMARFHHEARAAVRVRGEHSVRLLDVGETASGAPFLVMELLEGVDLATVLRQGPLPIDRAVLYILEACVGVAEVHESGIIHRDIKPGNLFLTHRSDATPLVKVLDFGIAKSIFPDGADRAAMTMTLVALGTPLYMSPEQVRSSRHVDARTDVWSLGAILYELVAGVPAFGGNTVSNITAQILEAEPAALSLMRAGVPSKLDKVVRTALAKKPDQRYPDVAALAAALAPFAEENGTVLAERAARVLHGEGRALQSPGSISAHISTPPGVASSIDTEVAVTHRFVRQRSRAVLLVGLAALALTGAVAGFTALDGSGFRIASAGPAQKGIAEHAAVSGAVARTLAQVSHAPAAAVSGAPVANPTFEPSELPDVAAGHGAHGAPAPPTRRSTSAPRPVEDDPLGSRR